MDGVASGHEVIESISGTTLQPAGDTEVLDLEHHTSASLGPAPLEGIIDELEQAGLDVRVHARWDRTGQSQRPFPRINMSSQACSLTVSVSRAISSLAASRS